MKLKENHLLAFFSNSEWIELSSNLNDEAKLVWVSLMFKYILQEILDLTLEQVKVKKIYWAKLIIYLL